MVIPRRFEWLGGLYTNDPASRKAIDEAFLLADLGSERTSYLLDYNQCHIPAYFNLGCGIPSECFSSFMKEFEKLDKEKPYDNGLTFKDVTAIEFEASRKGKAIQLRFVNHVYDLPYRIVGFAAVENKDGKLRMNKCWEMTAPYIDY